MICPLCEQRPAVIGCATVDPEFVGAYLVGMCDECHQRLHNSPLMARLYPFEPLALVHTN